MNLRTLPLLLAGAASLAGCSTLDITVYQYRGDLATSYRARLAKARGEANQSLAKLQGIERVKEYFARAAAVKGTAFRGPDSFVASMNRILNGSLKPSSGLPSPKNETPGESEADRKKRFEFNEGVKRELSVLETDLREYGALLLSLDPVDMEKTGDSDRQREDLASALSQVRQMGREILRLVEFPDFADVIADRQGWELINPVHTFGGLGKSEFVVYKDETGNYQIKSAVFDPSDVAQAVQKGTTGLLKTLAGVYGVPLTESGTVDTTSAKGSMAGLEAEAARLRSQARLARQENEELRQGLDAARKDLPTGTADADAALRSAALDRLVKDLEDYCRRVDALGGEKKAGPP